MNKPSPEHKAASTSNFIRQVIDADLASRRYESVRTRFAWETLRPDYVKLFHAVAAEAA